MRRASQRLRVEMLVLGGMLILGAAVWLHTATTGVGGRIVMLHRTEIGEFPEAVVVSARFGRAFVVHQDGATDVLNTMTGASIGTVRVGRFGYGQDDVAIAEREGHVFIATAGTIQRGTTVSMLDARTGRVIRTVTVGLNPHSVVVDERQGEVFVAKTGGVSVLDARTGAVIRTIGIGLGVPVTEVAMDGRTEHLFVATEGVDVHGLVPITGGTGAVSVVDARDGRVIRTVVVGRAPSAMAVDTRAGRLYVVSTIDRRVDVLDTSTGTIVHRTAIGGVPQAVAVEGRSGHIFVGTAGFMDKWGRFTSPSSVVILDARNGTIARVDTLGLSPIWQVVVDERRDRAYVVGNITTVVDTRTGVVLRTLTSQDSVVGGMVAVDDATGHLLMVNGGSTTVSDPWVWVPQPIHSLPFLRSRRRIVPPSVGVVDMAS